MKVNITLPPQVQQILIDFTNAGFEIYIVGGVVRDLILSRPLYDWDFTTNATPDQIQKLFPDSFYDNNYGTVSIKNGTDHPFQITTYRQDFGYTDNRRPDSVEWGKTLVEDLSRRDFTINAMAIGSDMKLIDPYVGKKDLDGHLIRAVGDPATRFNEDALRMMRAVRIASQLEFDIEQKTLEAINSSKHLLNNISAERIHDELMKIMASSNPAEAYLLLRRSGLAEVILPEMEKTFGVEQKSPGRHHIFDVGTHSVESLRHVPSHDPITRLATLIHDVGKVKTQRIYPDGRITFYNHEMESARIAENIAQRLRFSNDEKDKFVRMVRWHQFSVDDQQTDSAIRRFIKNTGVENVPDMIALRIGDRLGGGARETSWRLEKFKDRLIEVQKQPFAIPDLKINGRDVMEIKQVPPGPLVGKFLETLFNEVVENKLPNEREALLTRLKEIDLVHSK
jgi:tRNA nucleotidyltransferase (CCA-adding enzyme)